MSTIDLVVANLYPFDSEPSIELIDIGGPAMVRSAAKNHAYVGILVDPADYQVVLDEIGSKGVLTDATRRRLARKAFSHTAAYDAQIVAWFDREDGIALPDTLHITAVRKQGLRYGENPHSLGARYDINDSWPETATQYQGKEMSYLNFNDTDAAWHLVHSLGDGPAAVVIKHANPCGVAVGANALEAYSKAFQTDPTSAFGGIIALNCELDEAAAQQISKQFVEVLMAPSFTAAALEVFKTKVNVRILQIDLPAPLGASQDSGATDWDRGRNAIDMKRIGSGILLQTADNHELALSDLKVVTTKQPTAEELNDLLFAWKVAKYVKSNAIVFCKGGMTMGVGAGQMSRLDSARIASIKAGHANLSLAGTVVASDAFFPFRDGLDVVVDAGATCIIQPGGSMRDQEVIDAANERGVAMVFSGVRHFRH